MRLDPAVQAHLDAEEPMPPGLDRAAQRAHLRRQVDRNFRRFGLPGPDVAHVADHALDGRGVGESFRVRVYHPRPGEVLPVHVLVHGGGWVSGSIDDLVVHATARHRAVGADVAVVSVDYRLAPEHPYPVPLDDVRATFAWITAHASALGIDATAVSVGGASAGANLLAGAAVLDPDLRWLGMVLEVPVLDLTARTLLAELEEGEYPLGLGDDLDLVRAYLGELDLAELPQVSPLLAPSVAHLPPTWVLTAGLDPLRREGALFVDRLRAEGVAAEVTCYPDALHGSPILNRTWSTARRWHDDTIGIIRRIHARGRAAADSHPEEMLAE